MNDSICLKSKGNVVEHVGCIIIPPSLNSRFWVIISALKSAWYAQQKSGSLCLPGQFSARRK